MLSDWLYQVMFQTDALEKIVHDRAVWSPIYAIYGTLDKSLSKIFMADYSPRLEVCAGTAESTAPGQDTTDAPEAHQIEPGITVKATEGDDTWRHANWQVSATFRSKCP